MTIERRAEVPSPKKLLTATLAALAIAGAILIAFVLPAEYGIDPLGTGRALGLTALANTSAEPSRAGDPPATGERARDAGPASAGPRRTSINPVLVPTATGAPTMKDTFIAEPGRFQFDSRELTLTPGEGMRSNTT